MSCDIWNSKDIIPPPTNTYESKAHDIDFPNIHTLLSDGVQTHKIPKILLDETCVMRKVICKLKDQLRHDKGFKLFESTSRHLQLLFDLEISKVLKYFLIFFPQKYEKVVILPSRQMLEYVLVRLQGYAQVCARIVETTFKCTNLMKMRLLLGHQWEMALVIIAIASRIWFLCRDYAMKCCFLYNNLLPLLDKLELSGDKWLPDLYKFPSDLKKWLNYDWLIETPNIELPVGISKVALDYADVKLIGQYYHNYFITDDSDEDDNDVKFICNISNKKIALNKKQVKYLQSRITISVDDSDEEDKLVPSPEYDDIFELLDDNIQNIDSPNPKTMDDNILEDQNDNPVQIVEEFVTIDVSKEKNETKQDLEEQEEMEVEYNEEEMEEENNEEEEIKKPIKIFGEFYQFDTIEKLIFLLKNENLKRESGNRELCLFVHIPDNFWYYISYHIKYFIAMTIDNFENRNKYIIKSKNLLSSITLEKTSSEYVPTLQNKFNAVDVAAPMKLNGKAYLINSIDSFGDLQVFLAKEEYRRTISDEKCIFSNLYFEEWAQFCPKIKYLIVMGTKQQINSKVYLNKAKIKLTRIVLDIKDDDSSELEGLKQEENFDNIYKTVTQEDSYAQLFKYIQEIEDFVYPPKMISTLKEKNGGHYLKRLNDGHGISLNKYIKLRNDSLQSLKKNHDKPKEQPSTLVRNNEKILQELTARAQQRAEISEKLFESLLASESHFDPTINRKFLRRQRLEELEAKRNRNKRPAPLGQNSLAVPSKLRRLAEVLKTEMSEEEEEQERLIEKERNFEERREKIEKVFQAEEEELQRIEDSQNILYPPDFIITRNKLIEEKINKQDEIWDVNEEIIVKLEQSRKNFLPVDFPENNTRRNKKGKKSMPSSETLPHLNQNNIPTPTASFQNNPPCPPSVNNRQSWTKANRKKSQKSRLMDIRNYQEEQYMRRAEYEENLYRQRAAYGGYDYYGGQRDGHPQQPYNREYGRNFGGCYGGNRGHPYGAYYY